MINKRECVKGMNECFKLINEVKSKNSKKFYGFYAFDVLFDTVDQYFTEKFGFSEEKINKIICRMIDISRRNGTLGFNF